MPLNLFPHAAKSKNDANTDEDSTKQLPKGVVLGEDGKPCRTCTSSSAWMAMMKSSAGPSSSSKPTTSKSTPTLPSLPQLPPTDCPPDVDELGRSTWTFLHSLAATYPNTAPPEHQSKVQRFLSIFSEIYPCWVCAEDLRDWMAEPANKPQLRGQEEFGMWMCRAHNAVNVKLGKPEFDCGLWKQRWKDGWKDGSCD